MTVVTSPAARLKIKTKPLQRQLLASAIFAYEALWKYAKAFLAQKLDEVKGEQDCLSV